MTLIPARKNVPTIRSGNQLNNRHHLVWHGSVSEIRSFVDSRQSDNVFGHGPAPIYLCAGWYEKTSGVRTKATDPNSFSQTLGGAAAGMIDTPVISYAVKRIMVATTGIRTFHFISLFSGNRVRTEAEAARINYVMGQKACVCLATFKPGVDGSRLSAASDTYISIGDLSGYVNGPTIVNFNNASIGYAPRND